MAFYAPKIAVDGEHKELAIDSRKAQLSALLAHITAERQHPPPLSQQTFIRIRDTHRDRSALVPTQWLDHEDQGFDLTDDNKGIRDFCSKIREGLARGGSYVPHVIYLVNDSSEDRFDTVLENFGRGVLGNLSENQKGLPAMIITFLCSAKVLASLDAMEDGSWDTGSMIKRAVKMLDEPPQARAWRLSSIVSTAPHQVCLAEAVRWKTDASRAPRLLPYFAATFTGEPRRKRKADELSANKDHSGSHGPATDKQSANQGQPDSHGTTPGMNEQKGIQPLKRRKESEGQASTDQAQSRDVGMEEVQSAPFLLQQECHVEQHAPFQLVPSV